MSYKNNDGVTYEKELLDPAEKYTTGKDEAKLSKDEVAELFSSPPMTTRALRIQKDAPWNTYEITLNLSMLQPRILIRPSLICEHYLDPV